MFHPLTPNFPPSAFHLFFYSSCCILEFAGGRDERWGILASDVFGSAVLFCFVLQSCCCAREFTQRNLCVWKTKQTAGRGCCWERNSHLLSQVPLFCQFWWNRKNHQSIMDLNLNLCHIFNKLHKYISSKQHNSQCKTDVWVSSSVLTSLSVFRHQTIKLVQWRAQSQRWTCSALVRWLMLLS